MDRRKFIEHSFGALGAAGMTAFLSNCDGKGSEYKAVLRGPDHAFGHRLRNINLALPMEETTIDVVIVGGGIAGLAAARILKRNNINFVLLELENHVGGNAHYGQNKISNFPLGAHYLPIPNLLYPDLTEFLTEHNVITGFSNGIPTFNEYHLCFAPKERLYIHDHWQDGIVPISGVPEKDRGEINRFNELMDKFKHQKGADGKDAFAIPLELSSADPELRALDNLTFAAFLKTQGFSSPYLLWYTRYCTADDFGALPEDISAWAGIHYFSSRKAKSTNATDDSVLTWPEGNGFLANCLKKDIIDHCLRGTLTFHVEEHARGVAVSYIDKDNKPGKFIANQVIMAIPQFVVHHLFHHAHYKINKDAFQYNPWVVANISLRDADLNSRRGELLSWDNVIYGSDSLGYVNATHQNINQYQNETVITYYHPLTGNPKTEREKALKTDVAAWSSMILKDLKRPHPDIEKNVTGMDVWRWGHGMIRPSVGFMWGDTRKHAGTSINNRIHFAHSDLSGISIFEEAFYRGTEAAKKVLHG